MPWAHGMSQVLNWTGFDEINWKTDSKIGDF